MAERLTPGVYVEEVDSGIKPIQGVGTSTVGFIGEATRGIPDRATFVRGFADFQSRFGGHSRGEPGFLAQAVDAFFLAGGTRAFVVRVLPDNATGGASPARAALRDDAWGLDRNVLAVRARGAGAWSDNVRVHIQPATAFADQAFQLRVDWTEGGRTRTVERFDNVRMDPESEDYVVDVIAEGSQYIVVDDLFARDFLDADERTLPPIPERAATLETHERSEFRVPLDAELSLRWSGPEGAGDSVVVTFGADAVGDVGGQVDGAEVVLTPAQLHALLADQVGAVLRVVLEPLPAVLETTDGPWDASDGNPARVEIDGNAVDIALPPAIAARIDAGAGDLDLSADQMVGVTLGGQTQRYTLVAGDVTDGAATPAEVAAVLNRELTGIQAFDDNGTLALRSDARGPQARLAASDDLATAMGNPAEAAGAGIVGDLARLTAAELAAAFNALPGQPFEARPRGDLVRFVQVDTSAAHSIQWVGDPGPDVVTDDLAVHDGPAAPDTAAVGLQAPVSTGAYLIARLPEEADVFDVTDTDTITLTVGADSVDVDVAADDTLTVEALATRLTTALDGADLDDVATADAAGPYLVVTAEPDAGGVALTLTADANPPWVGLQTVAGASGPVVDRHADVDVVVTEALRPGRARALPALFGAARVYGVDANSPADPALRPALTGDQPLRLAGGSDGSGAVGAPQYQGGETPEGRTGLRAFDDVDIQMLAIPGRNAPEFLAVGMAYADANDVFFIADGAGSIDRRFAVGTDDVVRFVEGLPTRSDNAAMFYPWLEISDPVGVGRSPRRFVPPSGHMAGVFARTDRTRGVWKAPAGLEATVSGVLDLQHRLLDADQDQFNPIGLNCIRQRPGAGIVSWGSRTLSSDPEWRYVPVRRTALFLKESLRRGLQWVVFEPNDPELWGRIRSNIDAFMLSLFRQGAFQGTSPEEAFAVKCDRETNPQVLVDQGVVTTQVAFAPLKPAEFVVVQLSQQTLLT